MCNKSHNHSYVTIFIYNDLCLECEQTVVNEEKFQRAAFKLDLDQTALNVVCCLTSSFL